MRSFGRLGAAWLVLAGAGLTVDTSREGEHLTLGSGHALPVRFEENRGQFDSMVRYLARAGNATVFLTDEGATLALHPRSEASGREAARAVLPRPDSVLRMRVAGGRSVAPVATERLETKTSYFVGNDPRRWRSNVPTFARVTYPGVRPGVDLVFRGDGGKFEYDLVVEPGAHVEDAELEVEGAGGLSLTDRGDLAIETPLGTVVQPRPRIYQTAADGSETPVSGGYRLHDGRIAFAVAPHDARRALVIDPVIMVYGTYLGGTNDTGQGNGIVVDASGSAYVGGITYATDFPATGSAFQTIHGGSVDAYVAKLNPAGTALVYATYLGGSGDDRATSIAVDGSGDAYVTGRSFSTNFPTTPSAYGTVNTSGAQTVFVTKLATNGASLAYSTYIGPGTAYGIAVDTNGVAHVAGQTASSTFPTTAGAFATSSAGASDAFVLALAANGASLVYSTYLGGSGNEAAYGIALDGSNQAAVTGWTASSNFPTHSPLQGTYGGSSDAFLTKLNAAGTALVYSTYLGGSAYDAANGIAVDTGGVYLTGVTSSADFPTHAAFQGAIGAGGGQDAFITKLNASASALTYSTYLGGTGDDSAASIALDGTGSVYLTGATSSTDFPTTAALQTTLAGATNAFVAELAPGGSSLVYSTYLGGSGADIGGLGVAADHGGATYVSGSTVSANFPTHSPIQGGLEGDAGAWASFVVKLGSLSDGGIADASPTDSGTGAGDAGVLSDGGSDARPVDSSAPADASDDVLASQGGPDSATAEAGALDAAGDDASSLAMQDAQAEDSSSSEDGAITDGSLADGGAGSGGSGSKSGCGCVTAGVPDAASVGEGLAGLLAGVLVLVRRKRRRTHSVGGQS